MSTRTRIVLKCPGFEATGPFAVKSLIQLANPNGLMNFQFPPAWNRMTKREKLAWLAGKLPAKYKLELFQEPRGTRIKQSLYHASLAFRKQKRRHPQHGPRVKPVNPARGWEFPNQPLQQPPPNLRGPLAVDVEALEAAPVAYENDVAAIEDRIYIDFEEAPIREEEI